MYPKNRPLQIAPRFVLHPPMGSLTRKEAYIGKRLPTTCHWMMDPLHSLKPTANAPGNRASQKERQTSSHHPFSGVKMLGSGFQGGYSTWIFLPFAYVKKNVVKLWQPKNPTVPIWMSTRSNIQLMVHDGSEIPNNHPGNGAPEPNVNVMGEKSTTVPQLVTSPEFWTINRCVRH